MNPLLGFMLIDPNEVALRIYQQVEKKNWQPLFDQSYPLTTKDAQFPDLVIFMEAIAEAFSQVTEFGVGEWKICSRCLDPQTNNEISNAINMKSELLTLKREQDLIFKALLKETLHKI